jgi:hypothetical protein
MPGDAADAVAGLASDFYRLGNMSPHDLVKRSGYWDVAGLVDPEEIARRLDHHPDWLLAWDRYVEDWRGSPAWAYRQRDDGRYEVWFYDPDAPATEPVVFDAHARAAAEYALRQVQRMVEPPGERSRVIPRR